MPPDQQYHQIKTHEAHHGKGLVVRVFLSVASSTIRVAVRLGSVSPKFRGRTPWGWSEAFYQPLRENLRFDGCLEQRSPNFLSFLISKFPT
ncbi:hypothetical protein TNCV_1758681 [Trichonephila clavipes]|nr:hypothetical protein TNCV_1758681 [Trichonephila clavipes]